VLLAANPPLLGEVVFHCQQAAEKAMKGFLSWHDSPFGKTHDLALIGLEVDFVIETPKRVVPIEVKTSARVNPADARGLEAFLDEYGGLASGGLLLHGGTETFPLTRRVLAAPWWRLC
jgi:hypothetical protein